MYFLKSTAQFFTIVGICLIVLLPVVIFMLTNQKVTLLQPSSLDSSSLPSDSNRYSIQNEWQRYTLTLVNTQFLEYATAKLDIYAKDAFADPKFYKKMQNISQRLSISNVRFVLAQTVSNPIGFVVAKGSAQILGKGEYTVDHDTLVIRIAMDVDAMREAGKTDEFSMTDIYLNTAIKTMQYAKGKMDPDADRRIFNQLAIDMEEYLNSGLFVFPFRIKQT